MRFKQYLVPPVFPDEETSLRAHSLHNLLIYLGLTLVVGGGLGLIFVFPAKLISGLALLVSFLIIFPCYYLNQRGQVLIAGRMLFAVYWLVVTFLVVLSQGMRSLDTMFYISGTAAVGLVLGAKSAVVFAAAAIVAGLIMTILHQTGVVVLPNLFPFPPLSGWVLLVISLGFLVVPLNITFRTLSDALALARTEINQRKEVEAALRLSEERYRLISSVSSDYIFSTQRNEQGGLHLNWVVGAFANITGYTLAEFRDRGGWISTIHPDDADKDAQDIAKLQQNKRVITEIRIIRRDGAVRWVRVYAHPVWDEVQNRLDGIYGAVQDITDYKEAQLEREKLITELQAKNAELERFSYTVSHDLKVPLVTIRGFLSFLERDISSGNITRVQADISRINDATEQMKILLDDLLELSRIGRLVNPPQLVSFSELAVEGVNRVAGRLEQRGVAVVISPDMPMVYVDRARIVEVLQNLIDNAAKFMGEQAEPVIELGVQRINGGAVFFVRDNGVGIEPEYQDKVFGLFERLDPQIEGTGIGLALVKRIIEVHNGRIWVTSAGHGTGATFHFTLPLSPQASPQASPDVP